MLLTRLGHHDGDWRVFARPNDFAQRVHQLASRLLAFEESDRLMIPSVERTIYNKLKTVAHLQ